MTDYSELKKLAEAATQGEWSRDTRKFGGVVYGGPVQQWVNGSGQSQVAMTTGADWMRPGETEANADFIAAANPAAVLVLIAENARSTEREILQLAEIEGLIAENERLQAAHEQICTNYNQVSYASEERGKQLDLLKAELEHTGHDHDLLRNEYDQLRAENAGLRTGYEAYERVNAELRGEVEGLRSVMSVVTSEIPQGEFIHSGNAPGHCHEIPGVWDQGNGAKAGKECGWCKVWNAAVAMSKEVGNG